ncbi:MAG: hypothetical protein GXO90_11445, partial [FCB group bacterium]|nr:hypothetical protein [FCB group bacterium]
MKLYQLKPAMLIGLFQVLSFAQDLQIVPTEGMYGGISNSIEIINDTLFVSGRSGVWVSPDSGESWFFGGLASENVIKTISVTGRWIAATQYDKVWMSKDRGNTWIQISDSLTGFIHISGLAAIDTTIMIGTRDYGLFKTNDWGATWVESNNGIYNRDVRGLISTDSTFLAIAYGSHSRGVYASANLGDSWLKFDQESENLYLYNLVATSQNVYAADLISDRIIVSSDYGYSWQFPEGSTSPCGNQYQHITTFTANQFGLFCAVMHKNPFFSSDKGSSWTTLHPNQLIKYFTSCGSTQTITYLGSYQGLIRSIDGGQNWDEINTSRIASTITALIEYGGYLFAGTMGQGIYRTSDGLHWQFCNTGLTTWDIKSIVIHRGIMFAATGGHYNSYSFHSLFKSDDYGDNWEPVAVDFGTPFCLITNGTYLFMGNHISNQYGFYRSIYGNIWTRLPAHENRKVVTTACIGSTILTGTSGNDFFLSHDNGENWKEIPPFDFLTTKKIVVVDSTFYVLNGSVSLIYYSEDLGETWYPMEIWPSNSVVTDIIRKQDTLFASKSSFSLRERHANGLFFRTSQSSRWESIYDSSLTMNITNLEIFRNHVFLGTKGGGVLKLTKTVVPPVVLPEKIFLYQNYPNPFNTRTTICFDLPSTKNIHIAI